MLTRDHVLALAREAGISLHCTAYDLGVARLEGRDPALDLSGSIHNLECFAALVAAGEREACLEIADHCADADMHASMAANAIRARGLPPVAGPDAVLTERETCAATVEAMRDKSRNHLFRSALTIAAGEIRARGAV